MPSVKARHLLLVWIIAFTIIMGYAVRQGLEAHRYICALKQNLERQVEASRRFLITHPHGFPGVPAGVIRNGIKNQEAALRALAGLDC